MFEMIQNNFSFWGYAALVFVFFFIQIILHELFHVLMVKILGGKVLGFGFEEMRVFISYTGEFSSGRERIIFFSGGVGTSIVLGIIAALAIFYLEKPLSVTVFLASSTTSLAQLIYGIIEGVFL
jgi:hypothetical protein